MVEINRRLYMDEAIGEKLATYAELMAIVQSVCTALTDVQKTSQHSG